MILQENTPQTLLLFSDEDMSWLYEDAAFAARWAELFKEIIERGNRVKIIHTITRDINDMFEAIVKWIPIYMTGAVEPYFYPKLRDGLFSADAVYCARYCRGHFVLGAAGYRRYA